MEIESSKETECGESMESMSCEDRVALNDPAPTLTNGVESSPGENLDEENARVDGIRLNGDCEVNESSQDGDEEDFPMEEEKEEAKPIDEPLKDELEETMCLEKVTDDNNNNHHISFDEDFIDFKRIKLEKNLKLKQLQIELKNEEAKLILFKRLYYSQQITPNQQQQKTTPQGGLAQQKAQSQIKPGLNNGSLQQTKQNVPNKPMLNGSGLINNSSGQPLIQRTSILNQKVGLIFSKTQFFIFW